MVGHIPVKHFFLGIRANEQMSLLIVSDYRHSWPPTIPEAPQMCCRLLGGGVKVLDSGILTHC